MIEFLGRFHPVLVHLPIGILLLACFFYLLPRKYSDLHIAVPVMLFWGSIAAVASCITGYLLSQSGEYDPSLVGWHQWMGIGVALVSIVMFILFRKLNSRIVLKSISVLLLVMISITGHMGGSLTHGSEYLSFTSLAAKDSADIKPITDVQQAQVYQELVQPVLRNKCYSCHGPEKQKGKLRLDMKDLILKGGEDGLVLIPGNVEKSELFKRLMLPESHEDHMPPKEKPQLTENEIALLHWWINSGADFEKKASEIKQSGNLKKVLASFQAGNEAAVKEKINEIPEEEIGEADPKAIEKLVNNRVSVLPVSYNSNYLSVNFINAISTADTIMQQLSKLNKNVIWLKMDHQGINDLSLNALNNFENLTRLHLNGSKITDQGMGKLKKLNKLISLSLVGTSITAKGLMQLKNLKNLANIYLYQTKIEQQDRAALKKAFAKTNLDFGDYVVPTFTTDTTEVKVALPKKP